MVLLFLHRRETKTLPKIEVKHVTKIFGEMPRTALKLLHEGKSKEEIRQKTNGTVVGVNQLSFHVERGEIFVVVGLSGSGKSTLVRLLNQLIQPTEGMILIDGEDVVQMSPEQLRDVRRKKMGMVFEKFALLPHRTVLENVEFGLELVGVEKAERKKRAMACLEMVDLKRLADRFPEQLSDDMQQRVGIARALANDPDILLMDEAFDSFDPLVRKDLQDELLELQKRLKKTIVFTTQDLEEALRLGDRIAVLKDGAIVQIGTPEEILNNPADKYVKQFVEDVNRSKILTADAVMVKGDRAVIGKDGSRQVLKKMRERRIPTLLVTDDDHQLIGFITVDGINKALLQGIPWEKMIIREVVRVKRDTSISEILPLIQKIDPIYPIVVTDEHGKLLGMVERGSVLAAITGNGGSKS
jgi:glycine betaine/proline transport system ATP-binding protein